MAYSCNPATWRLDRVAGLSSEILLYVVLWRSGVRTKSGINMAGWRELQLTRLTNEGRLGRGRQRSRQKSPCRTVVGSRPWIGRVQHSGQYNRTPIFFYFVNGVKIAPLNEEDQGKIISILFFCLFFLNYKIFIPSKYLHLTRDASSVFLIILKQHNIWKWKNCFLFPLSKHLQSKVYRSQSIYVAVKKEIRESYI